MKEKKTAFFEDLERKFIFYKDNFHKKYKQISFIRIILFIAFSLFIYLSFTSGYFPAGLLLTGLFIFLFGILVNYHHKIAYRRNHYEKLATINREEIQRLNSQLHGFDPGMKFLEEEHPYTYDLDIFGDHSLYQLINRTSTPLGAARLAKWLKTPAFKAEISERQKAVLELKDKTSWCQNFQANGKVKAKNDSDFNVLVQWFKSEDQIRNKTFYKWVIRILPPVVFIQLLAIAYGMISFYSIIPVLLINGWMLVKNFSLVKRTYEVTSKSLYLLQPYTEMIRNMEDEHFESVKLQTLKNEFLFNDRTASGEIRSLTRILSLFDSRSNMLYGILNAFFLIDINVLLLAENWRSESGNKVPKWLDAVSEMEVLNSLAGFARANPGYGFPVIASQTHVFEVFDMGHPLIATEKRVNNGFKLKGAGSIAIITGSNMAGKSTFLRTVGINTVLALAGAPVCAQKLTISSFRIYSCMRTKDNLEENISSFYAELLRINQLLSEAGTAGDPVLFLLDELLKGTNSEDRHKGAEALIRQLNEMDTMGLVSTHDVELGKLADSIPAVRNFSFNSYFEGDELIFDYKLSEGLCKSFNATRLMEKMGIRLM